MTRAMELAPSNPSFLDMRNAILVGRHRRTSAASTTPQIWKVFATRGMGFFAGSLGGDDAAPGAELRDRRRPSIRTRVPSPAPSPTSDTGQPGRRASRSPWPSRASGVGQPDRGHRRRRPYTIGPVPGGQLQQARGQRRRLRPGRRATSRSADAAPPRNFAVRRDWAAASGGATVVALQRPGLHDFGCGPAQALDLSQATGWGSTTGNDNGHARPTCSCPSTSWSTCSRQVDITGFGVDPPADLR